MFIYKKSELLSTFSQVSPNTYTHIDKQLTCIASYRALCVVKDLAILTEIRHFYFLNMLAIKATANIINHLQRQKCFLLLFYLTLNR